MSTPSPTRLMPPMHLAASVILMVILDRTLSGPQLWGPPYTWIGALLVVGGFALVMFCGWTFHQRKTTLRPFQDSEVLITSGPYRWSRNPIYAGMIVLLMGVAVALGSATPWLVLPLFAYVVKVQFIEAEEQMLEARFGEQYRTYRAQVRRWI